ncbi:MAG: glycosyltransferase [Stenotrophomonas acidaminiphila]|nr:MAG: glycosyltransferase [Stenotrophomonas acidaminiphila]
MQADAVYAGEPNDAREVSLHTLVAIGLILTFTFLGLRGIWDPDEGRYTNVALTMLDSGNWLDPMRNEDTGHWTKPPLTYWLIAASVATFGQTPWAARLPVALSYLACFGLVAVCARRLLPRAAAWAPLVFGTMLLPACAAQLITTDFLLSALQLLAMTGFIVHRFPDGRGRTRPWGLLVMYAGFGLAFLTKGPPALVPVPALMLLAWRCPHPRPSFPIWHLAGVALFFGIALPWYVLAVARHAGLWQYFLGAELVDRVASDRFGRNGEWYGWFAVYLPTLLLGTAPWTVGLLRWTRRLPALLRTAFPTGQSRATSDPATLLLAFWILVPLLIFCVSRSRLPLYVLPLFAPIALAIVSCWQDRHRPSLSWVWAWVVLILMLRFAAAYLPTHKDASVWASMLEQRTGAPVREVIFVEDMARYGLHLHLDVEIERVARELAPQARFNPSYDETLWDEIKETGLEEGLVYITKQGLWPDVERRVREHGLEAHPLGEPYRGRVIFNVRHPPAAAP